jgi:hypothetical protein
MIVKHLSVRGWFRLYKKMAFEGVSKFQSPRGEGVVQTKYTCSREIHTLSEVSITSR